MKKAMNQSVLTFILNGVSILSMVFMAVSLSIYGKVNRDLNAANKERYELTYNANRFMNGSSYLTNEVRAFSATGKQEHYDNYWNEINTLKNRDLGIEAMQEIGITQEEQKMIEEMSAISNSLVPLEEQAMEKAQQGNGAEAVNYVYGDAYNQSIGEITALKNQFLETLDNRTLSRVERLQNETGILRIAMIVAVSLVGILQLINMIYTKRKILRPVIAVKNQMGKIADGNLSSEFSLESDTSEMGMLVSSIHETKRELKKYINDIDQKLAEMAKGNMDLSIDIDYRGEFLPIQNALSQILDALNQALFQINQTAGQVTQQSERMTSAAQVLSNGVVSQASAVEELSASMKDISFQLDCSVEDANIAKDASADAMKHLQLSSGKMTELTSAIMDISESSNKIGGIIKTIEDISFQTNILALNASVEAARAGEAGKGFAVVAGEVQNLANKSAVSAQDITDLIEKSIKQVEYGTALSKDTTEALTALVGSAQVATEKIEKIADSAMQQSHSLQQLKLGMEQISDVVQTNAATAQESVASAQELNRQAEELKVAVHRFRLRRS